MELRAVEGEHANGSHVGDVPVLPDLMSQISPHEDKFVPGSVKSDHESMCATESLLGPKRHLHSDDDGQGAGQTGVCLYQRPFRQADNIWGGPSCELCPQSGRKC